MAGLVLDNIAHDYDGNWAVADVSLNIASGEFVCLLGQSGCGKTTTLRLAAGLESLQYGEIRIGGEVASTPDFTLPPESRGVGMVFQDYALFPHLNVLQNVAFGLRKGGKSDRQSRALGMLEKVGMTAYASNFPHQLSGGEQQRVALARALAPEPAILLLDEPFSGLDLNLRDAVREETLALAKEFGITVMMVTHDPDEAMRMADRIAVMRHGRIVQVGTPAELYTAPQSRDVAAFFGQVNVVPGIVKEKETVESWAGSFPATGCESGTAVDVIIRPEAVHLHDPATCNGSVYEGRPCAGRGEVIRSRSIGAYWLIDVALTGSDRIIKAQTHQIPAIKAGTEVGVSYSEDNVFVFPRQ